MGKLNSIFNDLNDSFKILEGGYSARKLSAFFAIISSSIISYKFTDDKTEVAIVIVWLGFASLCLGLTTIEGLAKLRNGDQGK